MSTLRARRRRFSVLTCFEHGEKSFGSHAATLYPEPEHFGPLGLRENEERLPGRLMISSGGLIFEPDEQEAPLLRVNLKEVPRPVFEWPAKPPRPGGFGVEAKAIAVRFEKFQPFRSLKLESASEPAGKKLPPLHFALVHSKPADLVRLVNSLLDISMRPYHQQARPLHQLYEASEHAGANAASVDQTQLVDPLEAQLLQVRVQRVRPMLNLPALLLLTESRLYVSEASAGGLDSPLSHWPLAALERVVRRRHLLRHTAIELQFRRGSGSGGGASGGGFGGGGSGTSGGDALASTRLTPDDPETLHLALSSHGSREQLLQAIERAAAAHRRSPLPPPPEARLREKTEMWRHGLIDNYSYLSYLNDAAGRSLSDLTQYPVFPWVLKDYTSQTLDLEDAAAYRDLSKPVGALDADRLEGFRERCASLEPESRFLYGTHYSAPAFVAFFLLRVAPELTLHLHGGRFDEPDRQFASIQDAWASALKNNTDVKELIPQFYHPPSAGFLINGRGLELGETQSGTAVSDVALPPWADSPADFVTQCRAALESEHCSSQLHLWIDLIFGHLQRGDKAERADNLFCPQCYSADYEGMPPEERRAMEAAVAEFGQVPLQLFVEPHPPRLAGASRGALTSATELLARLERENDAPPPLPTHGISGGISGGGGGGGLAGPGSAVPGSASSRSAAAMAALLGQPSPLGTERGGDPRERGSRSSTRLDMVSRLAVVRRVEGLHSSHVTSVCHAEDGSTLVSTSANQLRIFCPKRSRLLRASAAGDLDVSACLQLLGLDLIALGSLDNRMLLYSVGRGKVIDSIGAHDDAVSCLDGSWAAGTALSAANAAAAAAAAAAAGSTADATSSPVLISGSWDSTVRLWPLLPTGLAPTPLRTLGEHEARVLCVSLMPSDLRLAASGSAGGDVALWDARKPGAAALHLEPHKGPTTGVAMSGGGDAARGGGAIVSCAADGSVVCSELRAGRPRYLRHAGGAAQSCARAFDGGAITAGEDGVVSIWDANRLVAQRKPEAAAGCASASTLAAEAGGASAADEFGAAWGGSRKVEVAGDAICSMHLVWAGENEARLLSGHASGAILWWGAA